MPNPSDVQGLVTHRYNQPLYAVLLFRTKDAPAARARLATWLPLVARGDQDPVALTGPVLNLAVTWAGLTALIADNGMLDLDQGRNQLDFAFVDQTPDHPAVADQLGFIDASAATNWWNKEFASSDIHMALYLAFDDAPQAQRELGRFRAEAASSGLEELRIASLPDGALGGRRPEGGVLHFGYRDGITAPSVDWADAAVAGKVNFREFLMGYPTKTYPVSPYPMGPWQDFMRDGSFACLAWIYQDVAAFEAFLTANTRHAVGKAQPGRERDWLAAKLMGRWPDGSPLVRHPSSPPAVPDLDDEFDFHDDADGACCPLQAHIRVANARNDELTFGNKSQFPSGPPRFIRRGFTYGPALEGTEDDGVDRGIVGTFVCARVNQQFYTALRWMQRTEFSEEFFRSPYSGDMQDALIGNRSKRGARTDLALVDPEAGDFKIALPNFITFRGVAVFFLPSLTALKRLAHA